MLGIKTKKQAPKEPRTPAKVLGVQREAWHSPPDQTVTVQGIQVPRKKKRDSLSILRALASTVEKV